VSADGYVTHIARPPPEACRCPSRWSTNLPSLRVAHCLPSCDRADCWGLNGSTELTPADFARHTRDDAKHRGRAQRYAPILKQLIRDRADSTSLKLEMTNTDAAGCMISVLAFKLSFRPRLSSLRMPKPLPVVGIKIDRSLLKNLRAAKERWSSLRPSLHSV
jgi:hypothetical protein